MDLILVGGEGSKIMQSAEMVFILLVFTLFSPLIKHQGMRFTGNVIIVHDLDSTQDTLTFDKWKMSAVDGKNFV